MCGESEAVSTDRKRRRVNKRVTKKEWKRGKERKKLGRIRRLGDGWEKWSEWRGRGREKGQEL